MVNHSRLVRHVALLAPYIVSFSWNHLKLFHQSCHWIFGTPSITTWLLQTNPHEMVPVIFAEMGQFTLISCGYHIVQNCGHTDYSPNHHYIHSYLSVLQLGNSAAIVSWAILKTGVMKIRVWRIVKVSFIDRVSTYKHGLDCLFIYVTYVERR